MQDGVSIQGTINGKKVIISLKPLAVACGCP